MASFKRSWILLVFDTSIFFSAVSTSALPADELTNGNKVESASEFPYIVRLTLRSGLAERSYCGGSLISPDRILTAKHCLTGFYDYCLDDTDCWASFRDLVPGRNNHEKGEM